MDYHKKINSYCICRYVVYDKLGRGITLFNSIVWPWFACILCIPWADPWIIFLILPLNDSIYPSFCPFFNPQSISLSFSIILYEKIPPFLLISHSFLSLYILCPFHCFEIAQYLSSHPCFPMTTSFDTVFTIWHTFIVKSIPFVLPPSLLSNSAANQMCSLQICCKFSQGSIWPPSFSPFQDY